MTLSNRQRRLKHKATPKAARPRATKAEMVDVPHEVAGAAVAAEVRREAKARVARQEGLSAEAMIEVGGMVFYDPQRREVRSARAVRVPGLDGIAALEGSGALDARLAKAAMAFRLCYQASAPGLGSCLGSAGEGRRVRDWSELKLALDEDDGRLVRACSAMELLQSYVMARLGQLERAVEEASVDGREMHALRMIAGEGQSVRQVAGGGGRAAQTWRDALIRALEAVAGVLRITER